MISKNSISKKLVLLFVIAIIVVTVLTSFEAEIILESPNTTVNLIADANNIYVDLRQKFDLNKEVTKSYINGLSDMYSMDIAICSADGEIELSNESLDMDYMDLDYIQKIRIEDSGDEGNFFEVYNMSEDKILVVYKERNQSFLFIKYVVLLLIPVLSVLFVIYIFISKKMRYLNYICNSITKLSDENFDYDIELRDNDELTVLAKEINNMSLIIKNKIEYEKKVSKYKNELITNISHDLRTPITSLIGYLNLLINNPISAEENQKYLVKSLGKANRINELITDLFEFSKLENNEIKPEKMKINIVEMIEQCIGEYTGLAESVNLKFVKEYSLDEIKVYVDPMLIIRVFENIINNAIKYSKPNSNINVSVNTEGKAAVIAFENEMKANTKLDKEKVFERLYRGNASRGGKIQGAGLGLSIAKSIIRLHEGKIWAECTEEKFKIFIKLNIV